MIHLDRRPVNLKEFWTGSNLCSDAGSVCSSTRLPPDIEETHTFHRRAAQVESTLKIFENSDINRHPTAEISWVGATSLCQGATAKTPDLKALEQSIALA